MWYVFPLVFPSSQLFTQFQSPRSHPREPAQSRTHWTSLIINSVSSKSVSHGTCRSRSHWKSLITVLKVALEKRLTWNMPKPFALKESEPQLYNWAVPMAPVNTENHDRLPEYTICLSSFLLVFEKCMKKYLKRLEDIIWIISTETQSDPKTIPRWF